MSKADNVLLNKDTRLFYLSDDIDNDTIGKMCFHILSILKQDDKEESEKKDFKREPIQLYVNSYGGSVHNMWALIDIIQQSKTPIYTYCTGYAMSAAFNIFLAGHKRYATKHATFMCHQIHCIRSGKYQDMVEDILPACKKEIMQHNGKLLVRPDSGDMVEISVKTIEKLWNTFEGSVNSKGYKVLDPHIGIIYGDGCTLNNVKKVWEELEKKGFAANNIVFGVGAFCFSAVVEPDGRMVVVTRDMFGIAMKATFGEVNGQPIMIYKDPKTDVSHLKKSHKGCCHVYYDENRELKCRDGYDSLVYDGALRTIFKDGEMCYVETFKKIRNRLNGGN